MKMLYWIIPSAIGFYFCSVGNWLVGTLWLIITCLILIFGCLYEISKKIKGEKEDGLISGIESNLSSIQKQLSGEEGGIITAIQYGLSKEGCIYKHLTQKRAKKKAEEILEELKKRDVWIQVKDGVGIQEDGKSWFPIDTLVKKLWSKNKSFDNWCFGGDKNVDDWWNEVRMLEIESEKAEKGEDDGSKNKEKID